MRSRPFFSSIIAIAASSALALSACNTMQTRDLINIASGAGGALLCYKNVGGGNARLVSGAACGAGAFFLADWIQRGNMDKQESARVQGEYQRALSFSPPVKSGSLYTIDTKTSEGNVRIALSVYPTENISQSHAHCRPFSETISVNGVVRSQQERRACREVYQGQAPSEWNILSN